MTGKNGLFVGDNINVNENIGTQHWLEPLEQAIYQLFEMKRLFLFIGNLAAGIEENVSTQAEEQPLCKPYSRRSELFRTNHF